MRKSDIYLHCMCVCVCVKRGKEKCSISYLQRKSSSRATHAFFLVLLSLLT
jgi:hypothetical protein